MMKKLLLVLSIVLFSINLFANKEQYNYLELRYKSEEDNVPTYWSFSEEEAPSEGELEAILADFIKSNDDFSYKLVKTETDELGFEHKLYKQHYKKYPIEFGELRVHLKNGKILSMNGTISDKAPKDNLLILSESEALKKALEFIDAKVYKWEVEAEESLLRAQMGENATYFPEGELTFISKDATVNHEALKLAYKFNIYAHEPMSRSEIYIDASDGSVVFKNSLIHTGNTQGTAVTGYSGTRTITVDSVSPSNFRLRQTASGNGIYTYNMQQGTTYANAIDFTDSDNYWNNANANLDEYATDAHWGAEQTYEYFSTKHNRNSINNNGFALVSYVHFASNFANAFWDGQRMTYGDGAGALSPFTALDIAAHEIAHGLTTFSANLIYQSEPGALNESFSDIFGAAVEAYARPNNTNWTIGEDIGFSLRSMANPNLYGDPDTRGGNNWRNVNGCIPSQQNDNCGVHINSGVPNYWFYLLVSGGSGTNDLGNPYSVTSIGMDKAAAIAFRNLTVYLGRNSDFDDARFYSIKAAVDLYGACSPEVASVTDAWHAVGVGNAYVPGVIADFETADTLGCQPPYQVQFENNSSNGLDFFWDFGDGQTSTMRAPSHIYNSFGNFDVKLVIDGDSCGVDSIIKQAYISVDTSNLCAITMQDGQTQRVNDCSGAVFDTGGNSFSYLDNENAVVVIEPQNAASVTLTFNQFDVEAGSSGTICDYDYLEIFDGNSTNAPSLGKFCNNNLPPNTITSSGGAITLQFYSDQALTRDGFNIGWQCTYPTAAPVVDFESSSDSTCTGEVQFTDLSTEAPSSWVWDFGDGRSSNVQNPTHKYDVNGVYNVSLIATNLIGSDTIVKQGKIIVSKPSAPAFTDDTFCVNQNATLNAMASGTARWYADKYSNTVLSTGNSFSIGQLNQDTSFWVEDFISSPSTYFGPTNSIGNGSYWSVDFYLEFVVYKQMLLESVFMIPNSAGFRTVELRDTNNNVLKTKGFNIPNTNPYQANLDMIIPAGHYRLAVQGASPANNVPDLFVNTSGVSYPYTEPGLVSITGSNAGSSYYGYFYYWKVKEPNCLSERAEVFAFLDTSCTLTSIKDNTLNEKEGISIFPNPSKNVLNVKFEKSNTFNKMFVTDMTGKVILEQGIDVNAAKTVRLTTISLSNGVYFISFEGNEQLVRKKFIVVK